MKTAEREDESKEIIFRGTTDVISIGQNSPDTQKVSSVKLFQLQLEYLFTIKFSSCINSLLEPFFIDQV